ncbi:MAG: DUF6186 family protein [Jiangellaceae bacterium]
MSTRDITIMGFVILGLAAASLLAAGRFGRLAKFGDVLDGLLARRTTRAVVVLVWWWLGWHFLVRTS